MLVKESLSAQIYQQLRRNLMAGRYEPGQKLKLRDLAEQLVSYPPTRDTFCIKKSHQIRAGMRML
jgi:DNA-binding GntR family transcriptional regulator